MSNHKQDVETYVPPAPTPPQKKNKKERKTDAASDFSNM